MRNKAMFIAGLATGYVLGTKAGRERYETIRRAGHRVVENPSVQEAAGVLQAQASEYVGVARQKIGGTLGESLATRLRARTHPAEARYSGHSVNGQPGR